MAMDSENKANNPIQPNHYKTGGITTWDVVAAWGLSFDLGNVVKYIQRHKLKNGLEDLRKARQYLDHAIAQMEEFESVNS